MKNSIIKTTRIFFLFQKKKTLKPQKPKQAKSQHRTWAEDTQCTLLQWQCRTLNILRSEADFQRIVGEKNKVLSFSSSLDVLVHATTSNSPWDSFLPESPFLLTTTATLFLSFQPGRRNLQLFRPWANSGFKKKKESFNLFSLQWSRLKQ